MFILKSPRPDASQDAEFPALLDEPMQTFGEFDTVQEALDEAMEHHLDETKAVIESTTGEDRRTVMEWRDAA
jgi:hypothetical protein